MSAIIVTLAEYRAKKIVKEQLRAKGHKLSDYKPREITAMAMEGQRGIRLRTLR